MKRLNNCFANTLEAVDFLDVRSGREHHICFMIQVLYKARFVPKLCDAISRYAWSKVPVAKHMTCSS